MSKATDNEMYHVAQMLIRAGQPVFPCHAETEGRHQAKEPYTRNGVHDATLNARQVKVWWSKFRGAAIGIATGVKWDVLDVDIKHGVDARKHLPYLQRLGYLNGCKKVTRTPSGGYHLYFKPFPGMTNKANKTLGLDVRSTGGYVLAPPSFISTDEYMGMYSEEGDTSGSTDEPLMWDQIRAVLEPVDTQTNQKLVTPEPGSMGIGGLKYFMSNCTPGGRNPGLYWAASRCVDDGYDPFELFEPALLTGLGEDEITKTINSVLKRAGVDADDLDEEKDRMFA